MKQPKNAANRYLWFRDSAVIWFRMAVPSEYRSFVGKALIAESLGTTDVREARVRAGKRRAELLEGWGAVEPMPRRKPTREELEAFAVEAGYDMVVEYGDARRKMLAGGNHAQWSRHEQRIAINSQTARRMAATGNASLVRDAADIIIADRQWDLPRDGDGYGELCQLLMNARVAAAETDALRVNGDLEAEHPNTLVERVRKRGQTKSKPGETLLEQFEKWAAERLEKGRKRVDTVNQDRKKIEQFADFVGRDRAIASITAAEVFDYREILRDLPPKWASKKAFKGLSMHDAAKRAREQKMPFTSYTTVNSHLSVISPLYKWLAKQPAWVGLVNPCDGLFHDDVKGKNPRPPFSTKALNTLLASPLFTGFLGEGQEHKPGEMQTDDWRKWVLLATMFTGARVGEIAQLRIGDVHEDRGVWLVHIREEEAEGLTTKNRKGHAVPLHSKLIAMGFIAFVERERAARGDNAPLFTGIKRNSRGHWGAVSRWYRDYFEAIGVKCGSDGIGPHSFRHTMTDRLRSEAELLDGEIAVILDHSTKTTTGGYGVLPQGTIKKLKGWIEAVTWDGVVFDHLIAEHS